MSLGAFFSGSNPTTLGPQGFLENRLDGSRAASAARSHPGCVLHVLERPCAVGNGLLDVCLGNAYVWANKLRVRIRLALSAGVIVVIAVLVMAAAVMMTVVPTMSMSLVIICVHTALLISNMS